MSQRKNHSPEFKAKVALAVLKGAQSPSLPAGSAFIQR